jgi:Flp pilus assembly protein TadB
MNLEILNGVEPNILFGIIFFIVLITAISAMTSNLLKAQRRDKALKVITNKMIRKRDQTDRIIISSKRNKKKSSNRSDIKPFDMVNPASIKRDLRRAGLPQIWIGVYGVALILALAIGHTILNAPLESFPPLYQSLAILPPMFFFTRVSLIGVFIESRRMKSLKQLILFIESVQRAVSVGAAPEDAVMEAIRGSENPIKDSLMPIKDLLELGYDFIHAINLASDQVNLAEFDIFVASLTAQGATGGSIGDVLKEVSDIARSRMDLQKKVGTMTAEGRFNAFLLGILPIALMMYLRHGQPEYFGYLWESDFLGPLIFFLTVGGAAMGAFVAVRIAKIEV